MSMSLEKAALITSILGIFILVFLAETLEPKSRDIGSITSRDIENYVKISGDVTYIKHYSTSTLFRIQDETGEIYSIFYGSANITKGPVTVAGKVIQYKGILEIEAEKIQTR
jgi:RecJ-like exonuclease